MQNIDMHFKTNLQNRENGNCQECKFPSSPVNNTIFDDGNISLGEKLTNCTYTVPFII